MLILPCCPSSVFASAHIRILWVTSPSRLRRSKQLRSVTLRYAPLRSVMLRYAPLRFVTLRYAHALRSTITFIIILALFVSYSQSTMQDLDLFPHREVES